MGTRGQIEPAAEGPWRGEGAAAELEPAYRPRLVYPERALRLRREGRVVVEFRVAQDGATQDLRVLEAEPAGLFEGAAMRYVAGLRYAPNDVAGHPVHGRHRYIVRFELRGQLG